MPADIKYHNFHFSSVNLVVIQALRSAVSIGEVEDNVKMLRPRKTSPKSGQKCMYVCIHESKLTFAYGEVIRLTCKL